VFAEKMHKTIVFVGIAIVVLAIIIGTSLSQVVAQEDTTLVITSDTSTIEESEEKTSSASGDAVIAGMIAIAVTVSMSCLGAAYAVGKVGAAAMGAASERPELMGRALIFVGLAEGIAIYGLIIAIMLLGKI
jgi:V/A-type H+-transporting ATPase subunit K